MTHPNKGSSTKSTTHKSVKTKGLKENIASYESFLVYLINHINTYKDVETKGLKENITFNERFLVYLLTNNLLLTQILLELRIQDLVICNSEKLKRHIIGPIKNTKANSFYYFM